MRKWLTILVMLPGACLPTSETIECADGTRCPAGLVCAEASGQCVSRDRILACTGLEDRAQCSVGGARGVCQSGVCAPGCGDAIIDRAGGEECEGTDFAGLTCEDMGFYRGPLRCFDDCTVSLDECAGVCGDGVRDAEENCDGNDGMITCVALGFDRGESQCSADCLRLGGACTTIGLSPFPGAPPGRVSAMAGTSMSNLIVGTSEGRIFAYDGWSWSQRFGTSGAIVSMHMVDNDLIFAVVENRVLTYKNGNWTEEAVGEEALMAVWGSGPADIYVTRGSSDCLHFDGTSWSPVILPRAPASLSAVWGLGADDVWLGARDDSAAGILYHYDGSTWQVAVEGIAGQVTGIAGGNGKVYVLHGEVSQIIAGTLVAVDPTPGYIFSRLSANDHQVVASDPFGSFYSLTDTGWQPRNPAEGWLSIAKTLPVGVWSIVAVVGSSSLSLYQGTMRQTYDVPTTQSILWADPENVYVGGPSGRVIAGDKDLCDFDGNQPSLPDCPNGAIRALWGRSEEDLFVVVGATLQRYQGAQWNVEVPSLPGAGRAISGGPSRVFVAGDGFFGDYDSDGFAAQPVASSVVDVWAWSDDDAVAVAAGDSPTMWRYKGGSYSQMPDPPEDSPLSIWATSADNIWVGGTNFHHYDGSSWNTVAGNGGGPYVRGVSENDVFLGSRLHFDGNTTGTVRIRGADNVASLPAGVDNPVIATAGQSVHFLSTTYGFLGYIAARRVTTITRVRPW